jgi:2-succinyl-6-hydroxy-2,4-cyclohexadiene-1-carboxylate synthase
MSPERDRDASIHLLEIGSPREATPLLLLHGFTGSARAWGAAFLAELSVGRQVLAVDLPGHGNSRTSSNPEANRIEAVVELLLAALEDREIERADWVGYSMGGRVALAAAAIAPERVRRLVLESASPGIEDEEEREKRRGEDESLATRIELLGMGWFVDYWMGLPLFESQHRLSMRALEEGRAKRLRNRPSELASALRGVGLGAQPSYWRALPGITLPVLVLTGALDEKFNAIGVRMARALPRGNHRSLSDVGHAVHLEDPARWLQEVTEFLGRPDREVDPG